MRLDWRMEPKTKGSAVHIQYEKPIDWQLSICLSNLFIYSLNEFNKLVKVLALCTRWQNSNEKSPDHIQQSNSRCKSRVFLFMSSFSWSINDMKFVHVNKECWVLCVRKTDSMFYNSMIRNSSCWTVRRFSFNLFVPCIAHLNNIFLFSTNKHWKYPLSS